MHRALRRQFEAYDRRLFWVALSLIVSSLLMYVYFLSLSIYGVIARKQAESQIASLSAKVSSLESRYAVLDKSINLELAHERGFVDVGVPKYISLEGTRDTLTMRDGEGF